MKWGIGSPLVALAMHFASAEVSAVQCYDIVGKESLQEVRQYYDLLPVLENYNFHQNPLLSVAKFGYESEFTLDRYASGLLNYYMPGGDLTVTTAAWLHLQGTDPKIDGRVEWIREHKELLFGEVRKPGNMRLSAEGAELMPYLPQQLIVDYTGNLEIILKPFNSFPEWKHATIEIERMIGNGSLQSTVGVPWKMFWDKTAEHNAHTVQGFLQFMSDFDAILKLQTGYERYEKEKLDRPYAGAFSHPFLGPLTALKRSALDIFLEIEASGNQLSQEQRDFVSSADNSWKYSGTTVYRPDIARGFVVFEVRDAHSNLKHVEIQVHRLLYFLGKGFASFDGYHAIKPFDSVEDFARFPSHLQNFLQEIYPARFIDSSAEYSAEELTANEVARNFAFPLRDWARILDIFSSTSTKNLVGKARLRYLEHVQNIFEQWQSKEISEDVAKNRVQVALIEFVHESSLFSIYMEQFFKHVYGGATGTIEKAE